MSLGRTALYYKKNPLAREKKKKYDSIFQKRPSQVKKRVQCNRFNRRNSTYGNGDKMDCSHQKNGTLISERRYTNRARGGRDKR